MPPQMLAARAPVIVSALAVVVTLACVYLWHRLTTGRPLKRETSGRPAHHISLTLLAVFVLCVAVAYAMYFVHEILSLHVSYLMIPVFGALGGLAGSIIRNDNHLSLVTFDETECRIRLGFVGDMILGLGGATAVVFLLGSTLNFDSTKPATYPLMVSIALIAGIFGQLIIEKAGRELAHQVSNLQRETKELQRSSASAFVTASMYQYDNADFEGAMKAAEKALTLESGNVTAVVAKARALKKLGRVAEALSLTQERLQHPSPRETDAQRAALLYNVVCYKLLLSSISTADALDLVRQSIALDPGLREIAAGDSDLTSLGQVPEFQALTAQEGNSSGA